MKKTWIGLALFAATFGITRVADAGSIRIQIGAPYVPVVYCPPVPAVVQTYYWPSYNVGYYYPPTTRITTRYYTPRPPPRPVYRYGHRAPSRTYYRPHDSRRR